jgi:hypothetical protein
MAVIYLASSWRNTYQKDVIRSLRLGGHSVYDFRNPEDDWRKAYPGDGSGGFQWSSIDSEWEDWSPWAFTMALNTPVAQKGFNKDFEAMEAADTCVLLLPSGRSAHIEAGYFVGHPGKRLFVLVKELPEPELMYKMSDGIFLSLESMIKEL